MKEITDNLESMFEDSMHKRYGFIRICGLQYVAINSLRVLDPIAYETKFNEWLDGEMRAGRIIYKEKYYKNED